jgi:methylmalonyl-CoA mutase
LRVAVISIDPSRRKSGGALLGDRIRMNAISPWKAGQRVFMRSLATRDFGSEISAALPDVIASCKVAGFDLSLSRPRASARATPPSCRTWTSPCT